MKLRLLLAFVILAVAPLVGLGWYGVRHTEDEDARPHARFESIVRDRLGDSVDAIARVVATEEREILATTASFPEDSEHIRRLGRENGRLRHVLVFAPRPELMVGAGNAAVGSMAQSKRIQPAPAPADLELVFPPRGGPTSAAERAFLERTRGLWEGRVFQRLPRGEGGQLTDHGWHIWYWGGGLNLMLWHHIPDGRIVAVEVDRTRLLGALVAVLPATEGELTSERTALLGSSGQRVYQWGDLETERSAELSLPLAAPLQAWRLAWWGPLPGSGDGLDALTLLNLGAVGLALLGLAIYFSRESARELRRAARRVTFVNQVSHELKTPLTNIRMYAELLDEELFDEDERARRYVGIIVSESQRLSRMIGNVLTFARVQRDRLTLRTAPGGVDDVIHAALEQFAPGLEAAGISVTFEAGAKSEVSVDTDAFGQIIANLLSNVEKYAAGAPLTIRSRREGVRTVVTVHDGGPGIPRAWRGRVFEPFTRMGGALEEGKTGTGIGLGIARDLARLHGGDLRLCAADRGACFELTLETPEIPCVS